MSNINQAVAPNKVIVAARISAIKSDSQPYFWNNGRWDSQETLATKMNASEARKLISNFAARPVGPMTPQSSYNTIDVLDQPLRQVG